MLGELIRRTPVLIGGEILGDGAGLVAAVERAKAALSPEALNKFFGPGGSGMAGFIAAIEEGRA